MLSALCILLAGSLSAEVADANSTGFAVTNKALVTMTPTQAYESIIAIGKWWHSEHTFFGKGRNMSIDARAGGCFCERDGKREVVHMRVIYVDPGKVLRMEGVLGPMQEYGMSGALTFRITPAEKGSEIEMTYRAGGYFAGDFKQVAPLVDTVLSMQLGRLKKYAETGNAE